MRPSGCGGKTSTWKPARCGRHAGSQGRLHVNRDPAAAVARKAGRGPQYQIRRLRRRGPAVHGRRAGKIDAPLAWTGSATRTAAFPRWTVCILRAEVIQRVQSLPDSGQQEIAQMALGLPHRPASEWRQRLNPLVSRAWRAFDRAASWPSHVTPAAPVLFFGDLDAYQASPLRVVTVGLNPLAARVSSRRPFQRFPLLTGGSTDREPNRYLDAMSAYFRSDPYGAWFSAFELLLRGQERATTRARRRRHSTPTSVHPSPPTQRTANSARPIVRASKPTAAALAHAGGSVAAAYGHAIGEERPPQRIRFAALDEWQTVHVFRRTGSGALRSRPYGGPCAIVRSRLRVLAVRLRPSRSDTIRPVGRQTETRGGRDRAGNVPRWPI